MIPLILASLIYTGQPVAWEMTCTHYKESVDALYSDPFFSLKENHKQREMIHNKLKYKTSNSCLIMNPVVL